MTYWPFWVSGLALAGVAVGHWLLTQRLMAVSGRFTALVNRLRFGAPEQQLDQAELVAALRAATIAEFGEAAVEPEPEPEVARSAPAVQRPLGTLDHVLFLAALAVGGLASSWLGGAFDLRFDLASARLSRLTGENPWLLGGWLLAGGVLVGFGTRMAGGCTSGHGLCGVSRLQTGSLLATLAFFGSGIVTALLLGAL